MEVVLTAGREHLEQGRHEPDECDRQDREVAPVARPQDGHEQCDECSRRDDAQQESLRDRHCDQRSGETVVHEADERAAQRHERREWSDSDERRREHAGHELAAGERQRGQSLGIERLVVAESEDREHGPPEGREGEHDDREIRRGRVSPRSREHGETHQRGEGRADRADREQHRALAHVQAVAEQPELQSDECSNHDSPCRSSGSPTSATNASSSEPPLRSWSSGPAHAIRPLTITAT